ncbi:MAG: hypothetical protein KAT62_02525 [Desulfuromonadales bacterium]|nr:hypothetical protein [Desulfuromonadales bacterium]
MKLPNHPSSNIEQDGSDDLDIEITDRNYRPLPTDRYHCLVLQEEDGSVLTWNTAEGTPAGYEILHRQAEKMHCRAWVQTVTA